MPGRRGRPVVRGVARTAAVAGTASVVSGRVHRRQQNRWAEQDAAAADQGQQAHPAPAPAPAASGENDTIAQLERLGALHDKGVLTDEEFAVEKAKLLG